MGTCASSDGAAAGKRAAASPTDRRRSRAAKQYEHDFPSEPSSKTNTKNTHEHDADTPVEPPTAVAFAGPPAVDAASLSPAAEEAMLIAAVDADRTSSAGTIVSQPGGMRSCARHMRVLASAKLHNIDGSVDDVDTSAARAVLKTSQVKRANAEVRAWADEVAWATDAAACAARHASITSVASTAPLPLLLTSPVGSSRRRPHPPSSRHQSPHGANHTARSSSWLSLGDSYCSSSRSDSILADDAPWCVALPGAAVSTSEFAPMREQASGEFCDGEVALNAAALAAHERVLQRAVACRSAWSSGSDRKNRRSQQSQQQLLRQRKKKEDGVAARLRMPVFDVRRALHAAA